MRDGIRKQSGAERNNFCGYMPRGWTLTVGTRPRMPKCRAMAHPRLSTEGEEGEQGEQGERGERGEMLEECCDVT